jgi:long-chain acyl-CoA synthetase
MSAGAPLAETVRQRAEQRLGAPVRQAYGLTEANLIAVNAPPDIAVASSSGKPVAGVEVRIEREDGGAARRGEAGEVLVRGANVMAGYLDDPLATRHVFRGGWLHTGDLGVLDADGRLAIVGRTKDLILRGGASIYPSEVEAAIALHPSVREVAVVGRPHDYYGEEVVAVVVARADVSASELDSWVRDRIARYKAPSHYAFAETLPRNASGKVLKRHLRDRLAAGELLSSPPRPDD